LNLEFENQNEDVDRTIIGLIGCGNIGTIIVRAIREGKLEAEVGALFDVDESRSRELSELLGDTSRCKPDFEEFIREKLDLVVEAASIDAVKDYGERVLNAGKDMIILSVGALLNEDLLDRLERSTKENGCKIVIPSGAIGGLDLLKAASIAGIEEILLTTTKNPNSLDEAGERKRTIIFEGSAKEAVEHFPKNINVAAAISITSKANLQVKVVSDPGVDTNTHEITAKGRFGQMVLKVSNMPSPDNPKTSYLAALSVIRTIKGQEERIQIGT